MSRTVMLSIGLAGLLLASFLSAAELGVRPSFDAVAKVAAVTTRDGGGRVQRFTDVGNQEFAVNYDERLRVRSVEAARGPHINDIVSVGYGLDGKLAAVTFRTGYQLFFDHRPNGTQVIRDSRGGALIRSGASSQPLDRVGAEESAQLAAAIADLESLMGALGQPGR
jgi:hypothetical protein